MSIFEHPESLSNHGSGLETFVVILHGNEYNLAVLDNVPIGLMRHEEYYHISADKHRFVINDVPYQVVRLNDGRYTIKPYGVPNLNSNSLEQTV